MWCTWSRGESAWMTYGDYVLDFFYDVNGTPIAMRQGYASSSNYTVYYYITNLQGDVIRLVDIYGNTAAYYEYDPYGNATNASGSHATINPLRYRGYVYDNETSLYYLQSRYYDPELGRFINADAYVSTGQGLLGNNMYAYCNNNPVIYADSTGNRPRFIPLAFGEGEPGISPQDIHTKRDVTEEVMAALSEACSHAQGMRANVNMLNENASVLMGELYAEFYLLVNHEAPWDIKRELPWQETIGTTFPGYNVEVTFNGMIMTPEMLGNYTYGYLGHAYGIPLSILIAGSYYAAGFPQSGEALKNETWDWEYIRSGYKAYD